MAEKSNSPVASSSQIGALKDRDTCVNEAPSDHQKQQTGNMGQTKPIGK